MGVWWRVIRVRIEELKLQFPVVRIDVDDLHLQGIAWIRVRSTGMPDKIHRQVRDMHQRQLPLRSSQRRNSTFQRRSRC